MTLEKRIGRKTIYASIVDDRATIRVDCDVYDMAQFEITRAAAEELLGEKQRTRLIQEVLPDLDYRLREIFQTGATPAEFDHMFGKPVLSREAYGCYPEMEG